MNKLNLNAILYDSRQKLAGTDARRMAVIHTGVTVLAALVITLLQYVLSKGIGNTSGLSGLQTRSVLETVQTVLQWANMLLMPFWNLGFLYVSLQWARTKVARKGDLLTGFHRVGPCIGLLLNRAMLMIAVMILCANISGVAYMMTSAASEILELAGGYGNTEELYDYLYSLNTVQIMELFQGMIPMVIMWAVLSGVLLIPLLYRFRMAEYVILDEPRARGLSSMLLSAALMRRRRWQLFKLDLRFWWYYGLKLLCTLLLYGDLILEAVGVAVPDGELAYLVTYGLYLAALFGVEVCFRPRVDTAYACAYETMKAMGPIPKMTVPTKPQDMPWEEE